MSQHRLCELARHFKESLMWHTPLACTRRAISLARCALKRCQRVPCRKVARPRLQVRLSVAGLGGQLGHVSAAALPLIASDNATRRLKGSLTRSRGQVLNRNSRRVASSLAEPRPPEVPRAAFFCLLPDVFHVAFLCGSDPVWRERAGPSNPSVADPVVGLAGDVPAAD